MNTQGSNKNVPARVETYNRVVTALEVGRNGVRSEEWDIARFFWHEVLRDIDWESAPPMNVLIAEEALVLRMLAIRLLRRIEKDVPLVERAPGSAGLCPAVESWMKIQERFRKVMKELLKLYGHRDGEAMPESLASMVQPILERGEGIVNELLSIEDGAQTNGARRNDVADD